MSRAEMFLAAIVAVVVPFGWVYPLMRLAYRRIGR
jgi:hypothetical protein